MNEKVVQQGRIPAPVRGIDIRTLPLEPTEAYIHSLVDGQAKACDIASVSGLSVLQVENALERLARLGAIDYAALPRPSVKMRAVDVDALRNGNQAKNGHAQARHSIATRDTLPGDGLSATIEDLHARFRRLSHYELLGVPKGAAKERIRKAYYDLVARLHPDRHAGKELRLMRGKMEELVAAVTRSYEVLKNKDRRAEYDDELADQRTERTPSPMSPDKLRAARKERLLRGLRAGSKPNRHPARISSTVPPPPTAENSPQSARDRAAAGLKRISTDHGQANTEAAERFKTVADEALVAGDFISATNAMKARASLDPSNEAFAREAEDCEEKSYRASVDKNLEQARTAERDGNNKMAAQAFERAAKGRPDDGGLWGLAVSAWLEAEGEARHIVELGQKAVLARPDDAELRILFARALNRAGMKNRAEGEVTRAQKIQSSHPAVKSWAKRIKQGES